MAWFNPADLNEELNNNNNNNAPASGGAPAASAWFNPAELEQQGENNGTGVAPPTGGAWFNPADLGQTPPPQQQDVQQISVVVTEKEGVTTIESEKKEKGEKGEKKKKKKKTKEDREKAKEKAKKKEREEFERKKKEKDLERKEKREKGVEYVDDYHGPWEFKMKVVGAKVAKRPDGTSPDPYVLFKTYAENLRTRAVKKTDTPNWNQLLNASIMDPLGKDWTQGVFIEVSDYHAMGEHPSLGTTKLCVGDMKYNQENDITFPLKNGGGEEVGSLHLIITVTTGRKVEATDQIKITKQVTQIDTPKKMTPKKTETETESPARVVVGDSSKHHHKKRKEKSTKHSFADNKLEGTSGVYDDVLAEEDEPESENWTYD